MKILTVGDTVNWKGSWNADPSEKAIVEGITIVENTSTLDGKDVELIPWESVVGREVVLSLQPTKKVVSYQNLWPVKVPADKKWAYAFQISRKRKES